MAEPDTNNNRVQVDPGEEDVAMAVQAPPPPDMFVHPQEEEWAWDLVDQVEAGGSGLNPLSDLEYTIHAIVSQGNVQEALGRIRGLQRFRELYNVQDTVEEGFTVLQQYTELFPGALLDFDIETFAAEGVMYAWNYANYVPSRAVESEETWRIHAVGFYYINVWILQPTLKAVREGASMMVETSGMSWENINQASGERLNEEIWAHLPLNLKRVHLYNTNSAANIAYSLCKRFLSEEHRRVVKLGCQCEWDPNDSSMPKLTLNDVYLQPSAEVATSRLLAKARQLLTLRRDREQSFTL